MIESKAIPNPTGRNESVKILEEIPSSCIIESYQNNYTIDVSGYFITNKSIYLCECPATGYRFYYPQLPEPKETVYDLLIQKYGLDRYYASWRWEHSKAKEVIRPNSRVLEIGCGTGNFLDNISDTTKRSIGIELNHVALEIARSRQLDVCDLPVEVFSEEANNKNTFDYVCTFQVLEHVANPYSFLNACKELLNEKGKLIIGIPNNNPFLYKNDKYHTLNLPPHHYGLWNKQSIRRMLSSIGMTCISVEIENIDNIPHWLEIQRLHYIPWLKTHPMMTSALKKLLHTQLFKRLISGRNLLVIAQRG